MGAKYPFDDYIEQLNETEVKGKSSGEKAHGWLSVGFR
jgi:hypothetical protein